MPLYGKQLAKQVPDSTTGHQARTMYGSMTAVLAEAYATLAEYDSTGLAQATGLDAGSVETARNYLDDCNGFLQKHYPQMPATDAVLTDQQLAWLRADVSTSSTACQQIDQLFATSFLSELSDSICEAAGTVGAAVANTVSKAASFSGSFLSSFLGGMWWLVLGAIAVGVLVWRAKKKAVA